MLLSNLQFSFLNSCHLKMLNFLQWQDRAGLFPLNTGDSIAAMPTRAEKVAYFLQHVVEPGAEEYLPKLLSVMKESKVANLVRLADDIQAVTGVGKYVNVIIISYS